MIDAKHEAYQEYMRRHRIPELFEELCTALAYKQPEDVRGFLAEQLQARLDRGAESLPLFTEQEVENVFYLYNLKRERAIPRCRALEALRQLAQSGEDPSRVAGDAPLPEQVDLEEFKRLAQKVMGVTFSPQ